MADQKDPDLELDALIIQRARLLEEGDDRAKEIVIPPLRCRRRTHLLECEGPWLLTLDPDGFDLPRFVRAILPTRRGMTLLPLECWTLEDDRVVDFRLIG